MEWVRVKSEGIRQAAKARQVFEKYGTRSVRVGSMETIVQVRNGEDRFLDKLGVDIGFKWRYCQAPEAELKSAVGKARCGIEMQGGEMLARHQNACNSCRRVNDPDYRRKTRSTAKLVKVPAASIEPKVDQYVETVIKPVVPEPTAPASISELLKMLTEQRDHALDIAGQYDGVIAAAVNLDLAEERIKEIEAQMAAHRKALAEFISGDPE